MDTRQLNFVMSQGLCLCWFLYQYFWQSRMAHHLAYLKRCGLGIVLLALSMHLA